MNGMFAPHVKVGRLSGQRMPTAAASGQQAAPDGSLFDQVEIIGASVKRSCEAAGVSDGAGHAWNLECTYCVGMRRRRTTSSNSSTSPGVACVLTASVPVCGVC